MSYSYQFRLKIIKLVTEQDYGIREVAKLHQISHALVIYWLKAFRERGLDGVKSPYTNLQTPKIVKPKMKKKDIEIPETTDFSPKAFKKLQRELALARAEIAYLKELEALDQDRLNEEVLHGFSSEIVKKYWIPKPFIKSHCDAKALNEEAAEILEEEKEEIRKEEEK